MSVLLFYRLWFRVTLLLLLTTIAIIILYQLFRYLRGARYRDAGIPCGQCHAVAFPVESTTRRYRCHACGSRFEGLEHF
jgi:hypothetical protein